MNKETATSAVLAEKARQPRGGCFIGKSSAGGRSPTSHCRRNIPEIGCAAFQRELLEQHIGRPNG
jgi:hypothetical protein